MKKISTLFTLLLFCSIIVYGQTAKETLQFIDKKGNIIKDGSTITVTNYKMKTVEEEYEQGNMIKIDKIVMEPDIYIKNISNKSVHAGVKLDISSIPTGNVQVCLGTCTVISPESNERTSAAKVISEGKKENTQLEWIADYKQNNKISWTLGLTAGLYKEEIDDLGISNYTYNEDGPCIKINFICDPAGIETVEKDKSNVKKERFNLLGQKIDKPFKGINIIKYSNGKTIKQILR